MKGLKITKPSSLHSHSSKGRSTLLAAGARLEAAEACAALLGKQRHCFGGRATIREWGECISGPLGSWQKGRELEIALSDI